MSGTRPDTSPARSIDEEFLALVCADQQLLRTEFDAIVSHEWPDPPPTAPGHRSRDAAAGRRGRRGTRGRLGPMLRLTRPGTGWVRERSPPARPR